MSLILVSGHRSSAIAAFETNRSNVMKTRKIIEPEAGTAGAIRTLSVTDLALVSGGRLAPGVTLPPRSPKAPYVRS